MAGKYFGRNRNPSQHCHGRGIPVAIGLHQSILSWETIYYIHNNIILMICTYRNCVCQIYEHNFQAFRYSPVKLDQCLDIIMWKKLIHSCSQIIGALYCLAIVPQPASSKILTLSRHQSNYYTWNHILSNCGLRPLTVGKGSTVSTVGGNGVWISNLLVSSL